MTDRAAPSIVTRSADPGRDYAAGLRRRREAGARLPAYDDAGHRDPLDMVAASGRRIVTVWRLPGGDLGLVCGRRDQQRLEVAAAVRFSSTRFGFWIVPAGTDLVGAALLCGLEVWRADRGGSA